MRRSFWDRFKDSVLVPATEPNKGKGSAMANDIELEEETELDEDGQDEAAAAKPAKKAGKAKKGGKAAKPKKEKPKTERELREERIKGLAEAIPLERAAIEAAFLAAVGALDAAIIASDPTGVGVAQDAYDAARERAKDCKEFGKDSWRREEALSEACAAPAGEIPKWGQDGVFTIEHRDIGGHVVAERGWHGEVTFKFYAARFDRKFPDYRGVEGLGDNFDEGDDDQSLCLGLSVEERVRSLIDTLLDDRPEDMGGPLVLPRDAYEIDPNFTDRDADARFLVPLVRGVIATDITLPNGRDIARNAFRLFREWQAEDDRHNGRGGGKKAAERKFPVPAGSQFYRGTLILALSADDELVPVPEFPTEGRYFTEAEAELKEQRVTLAAYGDGVTKSNSWPVLRYVADAANAAVRETAPIEGKPYTPESTGALDPESPGIPFHEYANLFPMMSGKEADEFNANMKREGFRADERIMLFAGTILDGRNRYRGALNAKFVTPDFRPDFSAGPIDGIFENFDPEIHGDPLGYVISKNLKRRHLNEGQRAMVAGKLANLKRGQPAKAVTKKPKPKGKAAAKSPAPAETSIPPIGGISAEKAAEQLNVGTRSVERARVVLEHGAPELQQAVEQGTVAISVAAEIATLPQAEQTEIVARGEKEIVEKAREIGQAKRAVKREKKLEKISAAARGNGPLPNKKYAVLYADPAWNWETWSEKGTDRTPGYATATLEQLCALRLGGIAADDAVLYLWATAPKLLDALKLMKDAGFDYVSQHIWDKEWQTTGYWVIGVHEILLVGTKGNIPAPLPGTQEVSIYRERRTTEHSRKPAHFAEMIDRLFPGVPKIELFHRDGSPVREGWDYWGNQSSAAAAAEESPMPAEAAE